MKNVTVFGLLLLCQFQSAWAGDLSPEMNKVVLAVNGMESWIADLKICPAELLPKRQAATLLSENTCKTNPNDCLQKCKSGDGDSCYWLAYEIQEVGGKSATFAPLFQRSCKLGVMSGCTNRTAGLLYEKPNNKTVEECAVQTFSKVCDFDDPWACTMYALHLSRGIGVKQNFDLALEALKKSCKYGDSDPACLGGKKLKRDIEQAKINSPAAK